MDELAQAFAQVMGTAPKAKAAPPPETAEEAAPQASPAADLPAEASLPIDSGPADAADACPISPRSILEAMLFVGDRQGQPLSAGRAAELMRGVEPEEIPRLIAELNQRYTTGGCPYHVVDDEGGYRMTLRTAFHPLRGRFYGRIREARLSQAAIDVLAIVAYQQPLTSDRVSKLRGKPSSHVLAQLVRRGLLAIQRQPDKPRTAHYRTTDRFLELFGLQTLADLPQSEEPT